MLVPAEAAEAGAAAGELTAGAAAAEFDPDDPHAARRVISAVRIMAAANAGCRQRAGKWVVTPNHSDPRSGPD